MASRKWQYAIAFRPGASVTVHEELPGQEDIIKDWKESEYNGDLDVQGTILLFGGDWVLVYEPGGRTIYWWRE